MRRSPASAGSETYEFKMTIFENGEPKDLLQLLMNFKNTIDRTETTKVAGIIKFICTLLRI